MTKKTQLGMVKIMNNYNFRYSEFLNFYSKKAIKKVDVEGISGTEAFSVAQEALTLAKLNHPFIIKYFDSFLEEDFFYIITELCEVRKEEKKF